MNGFDYEISIRCQIYDYYIEIPSIFVINWTICVRKFVIYTLFHLKQNWGIYTDILSEVSIVLLFEPAIPCSPRQI